MVRYQICQSVARSFADLWIIAAFNSLVGIAILLIACSDAERPAAAAIFLCLVTPALGTMLLIILDGLMNAFDAFAAKSEGDLLF